MQLGALQAEFLRKVFDGGETLVESVVEPDGLTAAKRLDIYRNNVFSNYRGALEAVYPAISRLVGAEFFRHAADRYSQRFPSASGDIHHFGGKFAALLADMPNLADYPYLPDTARLEWLVHEVFHAADHPPFDLRRLQQIDPDEYANLKFKLNPAARLIESPYPIRHIWEVNQPDYTGEIQVDFSQTPAQLLVIRRKFVVEIEALPAGDFALLTAFARGKDFGQALEQALALAPHWDAGAALQRHVLNQALVDLES
jgi:hypothetical protein